jgi:hypothetical protein
LKHYASRAFWGLRGNLPEEVRALADKNFELWFWIGSHADYDKNIDR